MCSRNVRSLGLGSMMGACGRMFMFLVGQDKGICLHCEGISILACMTLVTVEPMSTNATQDTRSMVTGSWQNFQTEVRPTTMTVFVSVHP